MNRLNCQSFAAVLLAIFCSSCESVENGVVGINASDWNSWGGAVPFSDTLRVTPGVREVALADHKETWRPDSGEIEFNSDGVITRIPHKAKFVLSMRDGHSDGVYQITYAKEPWAKAKYVDAHGVQKGSEFTRRGGNGTLTIDVEELQNPNAFECRLVGNDGLWRPGYVNGFKPFKIVRYMDPQSMNKPWSGPRPPQLAKFEGHENYGASAETIVNLSLATKTQPWICVHHSWTDADIRRFFQKFQAAGLVCFVEFGNELWNGDLHHGRWARKNGGSSPRVWAARQSVRVAKIAKEYGFINVLATQMTGEKGQLSNTKAIVRGLGPDIELYDYLAGNGYFGGQLTTTGDLDRDVARLNQAMEDLIPRIRIQAKYARSVGLKYALYECGPGLTTVHAAEINRHEGMRGILKAFAEHIQEDCDVACIYADIFATRGNRKGDTVYAWGLRENGLQSMTPKLAGVWDAMGVNPKDPKPD